MYPPLLTSSIRSAWSRRLSCSNLSPFSCNQSTSSLWPPWPSSPQWPPTMTGITTDMTNLTVTTIMTTTPSWEYPFTSSVDFWTIFCYKSYYCIKNQYCVPHRQLFQTKSADYDIGLVSCPARWSFSFILGHLHQSSIFPTSRRNRNIVQLCTNIGPHP